MPTNNVRKISYNVDNNSDNKDNFKGVALTKGNSEYAKFFFCFFVSFFFFVFFFIHQNYEEINDNFAVSEYLKKLHRQKSK